MRPHRTSLELIILAPVVVFLLLAGFGSYFLILNSFQEFADRTIHQSFRSLSNGVYSIVDRGVDRLNKAGQTGNPKATRIRQVSTLIEIEDFARKNEIGVVIHTAEKSAPVLVAGLPADATNVVTKDVDLKQQKISLSGGDSYYSDSFEFTPWNWRIVLLKNAGAYDSLLSRTRYFYVVTGAALVLIAVFLIVYLRRTIAHPIHLIVDHFRAGETPDYHGIREFEFLSDSIGEMMAEVADNRDHLEEMVRARTAELENSNKIVSEKNKMLESLSSQLSKYLSPQVFASIFSGAQSVELASRRKKLTVFFSDIVTFTETTDNLEPEELTDVLNHYLTEMSEIALEYGATIDKFIGDAMLLFFGDPETRGIKKDAKACVFMAIAMQQRMRELEQEWRDRGLERPFRIRMGISTGFCTVGNFGSRDRMDYTIIGNEVNLAARLESAAEPGSILLAHETNSLVQDMVLTEEQPPMAVKGFLRPIKNYKVAGIYDDLAEEGRVVLQERDGLRVFVDLTKQSKAEAIASLEDVLSQLKD